MGTLRNPDTRPGNLATVEKSEEHKEPTVLCATARREVVKGSGQSNQEDIASEIPSKTQQPRGHFSTDDSQIQGLRQTVDTSASLIRVCLTKVSSSLAQRFKHDGR